MIASAKALPLQGFTAGRHLNWESRRPGKFLVRTDGRTPPADVSFK